MFIVVFCKSKSLESFDHKTYTSNVTAIKSRSNLTNFFAAMIVIARSGVLRIPVTRNLVFQQGNHYNRPKINLFTPDYSCGSTDGEVCSLEDSFSD